MEFNNLYNKIIMEFGGNTPESKFKWKQKRYLARLFGRIDNIDQIVTQTLEAMKQQFQNNVGNMLLIETPNGEKKQVKIVKVEYPYVFVQTNNFIYPNKKQIIQWNIGMCLTQNGINKLQELAQPGQAKLNADRKRRQEEQQLQTQRKIEENEAIINDPETRELVQAFNQNFQKFYTDYIYDNKPIPNYVWDYLKNYHSKIALKGLALTYSKYNYTPQNLEYADYPQYGIEKSRADQENRRNSQFVNRINSFI